MPTDLPGDADHPTWPSVLAVFVGYGVILAVVLVALFVLPYLAFVAFA